MGKHSPQIGASALLLSLVATTGQASKWCGCGDCTVIWQNTPQAQIMKATVDQMDCAAMVSAYPAAFDSLSDAWTLLLRWSGYNFLVDGLDPARCTHPMWALIAAVGLLIADNHREEDDLGIAGEAAVHGFLDDASCRALRTANRQRAHLAAAVDEFLRRRSGALECTATCSAMVDSHRLRPEQRIRTETPFANHGGVPACRLTQL